ncbi:hypothetical protein TNCV_1873701 [Trichonephila clavipes]|nr:hypothetical protein TNCV_1873701 [Trichonephila clavipes]
MRQGGGLLFARQQLNSTVLARECRSKDFINATLLSQQKRLECRQDILAFDLKHLPTGKHKYLSVYKARKPIELRNSDVLGQSLMFLDAKLLNRVQNIESHRLVR